MGHTHRDHAASPSPLPLSLLSQTAHCHAVEACREGQPSKEAVQKEMFERSSSPGKFAKFTILSSLFTLFQQEGSRQAAFLSQSFPSPPKAFSFSNACSCQVAGKLFSLPNMFSWELELSKSSPCSHPTMSGKAPKILSAGNE